MVQGRADGVGLAIFSETGALSEKLQDGLIQGNPFSIREPLDLHR